MVKRTRNWGLTNSRGNQGYLCKSHIHSILQNPFYYGIMKVQKTNKEYPHIYPPIIDKGLFDECQKIRLGWNKQPFKWGGKEYVFRGLIKCAVTGRVVTAFTQKKSYTDGTFGEWTYLRCWNPKNPEQIMYVKEEKILQEVEKIFDSMHLDAEMLEKAIGAIRRSASAEQDHHKEIIKGLEAEHTKIQSRIERLTDLFLDGEFDENEYRDKRKSLEQKRDEIVKEIESSNRSDNNFAETLISCLQLASEAGKTFRGSTVEQKRRLVNLVFDNLELKGQKLVYTLRPPFDSFVKTVKNGEWRTLAYRLNCEPLISTNLISWQLIPKYYLGANITHHQVCRLY